MPKSQSDFLMKRLDALSNQRSKNKKSLNIVKRHSKSTTQNSSSILKAISSAVLPTPAFV